jgi:glycopeptide antibiotics resistance protein
MTSTEGYLTVLPGYLILPPAVLIGLWILCRREDRRWTILALLALAHVTAVVALTIFPIPIGGQDYYRGTRGMSDDNIVPFATILGQLGNLTWDHVRQLLGNMLALAPFGIYGPALWPALRGWRRLALAAAAFGCGIELVQYAGSLMEGFSYRITDVDDAIMNAAGAVLVYAAFRWATFRWAAFHRPEPAHQAARDRSDPTPRRPGAMPTP